MWKDSAEFIGVNDYLKALQYLNHNEKQLFFDLKGVLVFDIHRFSNGRLKAIYPIGFEEVKNVKSGINR